MQDIKDYVVLAVIVLAAVIVGGATLNAVSPAQKAGGVFISAPAGQNEKALAANPSVLPWLVQPDRRLISVSGSATRTYQPDQAQISLGVETLDKSASVSQQQNADLSSKVRDALKSAGVPEENIKTTSYALSEEFEWNETLRKSESIGFRAINVIEVKLTDLASAGKVIDAAVGAGVNRVNSITFSLTREREAQVRSELLAQAAADAKDKAAKIASGFGVGIANLYTASESYSYTPVYNRLNYAKEGAVAMDAAQTPITPGDVRVTADISAQFELQ
ncbi:MAG TPA: SIMPL domain-containing protein [Candidatus Diapherotrites archaeon]|uniref:SIMPL domain-containing protein n=1 Tax=Candidatus Iainarchaeum sp. TaxID=3101447 RepID=A0A7J4IXL5_9ARCH|nr:SIMPL domain-containing protein [Candidatus Diapherotrites archaeon]